MILRIKTKMFITNLNKIVNENYDKQDKLSFAETFKKSIWRTVVLIINRRKDKKLKELYKVKITKSTQ